MIGIWERILQHYKGNIADVERDYPEKKSVLVDYNVISSEDSDFAESLLVQPNNAIYAGEKALKEITGFDINVRIMNLPKGVSRIGIRELRSEHLGKFIAAEGLVRKATEVRPKLKEAAYQCARCGAVIKLKQDEMTAKEPLECYKDQGGCGKSIASTRFKLLTTPSESKECSVFTDTQKLEIQESPEGLRGGSQPQRLVAYAEDDITGSISPGDRVVLNGVLRSRQRKEKGVKSTVFDIFLDVNSIEIEEHEFEEISITPEEEEDIIKLSQDKGVYQKIVSSIAPTIHGMIVEKEALALQLFGGVQKTMPDSTKVRGDIHVLLVGDPGTAKSQLLRYITQISPRGIYASGKSASAAGLTAAAVRDEFGEGRWTLEAGALVLADKGIAAIDEMDKMSTQDRSAMHEAMEQQCISVAKAGITATLHSRCALLGAANPKFGRFDTYTPISEQIDMPPALLSRFDLIFSIEDKPETKKDTEMAEHILRLHYAGEIGMHRQRKENEKYSAEDEEIAMKCVEPEIQPKILRKYIAYSKRTVFPVITKEAETALKDYYLNLRKQGEAENAPVPITPRQLEAFVRLSEASAKMRLSNEVTREDADRAIRIMDYCMRRVYYDYEADRFDVDVVATGMTHSQRERHVTIVDIIRELSSKSPDGAAEYANILERAKDEGIPDDKAEKTIEKLKREGRIFERRNNRYTLV
ncbi:MAG: minichromosome maintenance protein MCM [Candidatus Thermoplasmatota archaeon]|nr:minichromosome maintenance protein MCM [Candidatus Thermoplasmatota archaeon]